MRTTLTIDDDVLEAAREMAAARSLPLGAVVSDLARRGLSPYARVVTAPDGFPIVVSRSPRPITSEDVQAAVDEW